MPPKFRSKQNNKISNYTNNTANLSQISTQSTIVNANDPAGFEVADTEIKASNEAICKPVLVSPEKLQSQIKSFNGNAEVKQILTSMCDAYSSIAKAVECNHTNVSSVAQNVDENIMTLQNIANEITNDITKVSNRHSEYVEKNENDKLEMNVKNDIRYFKSQMTIFLKNDNRLNKIGINDCSVEAEKIIKEQGLSLQRAYITKAILLSGMKRINNVNKLTKYLYVHFSDSFTAERLITEMISRNKSLGNQPNVIFTMPSSYDIQKVKSICNELRTDGFISKVFLGDDSIKVTLNKNDPNDNNEKPRKIYVRNYSDLDKLRKNVSATNHHIPSRTYYNKNWNQNWQTSQKREKRKADDSYDNSGTLYSKKTRNDSSVDLTRNEDEYESAETSMESVVHKDS